MAVTKLKCQSQNYQCGKVCIQGKRNCRKKFSSEAQQAARDFTDLVKKARESTPSTSKATIEKDVQVDDLSIEALINARVDSVNGINVGTSTKDTDLENFEIERFGADALEIHQSNTGSGTREVDFTVNGKFLVDDDENILESMNPDDRGKYENDAEALKDTRRNIRSTIQSNLENQIGELSDGTLLLASIASGDQKNRGRSRLYRSMGMEVAEDNLSAKGVVSGGKIITPQAYLDDLG